ncbi:Subtilisin-like protease SBT1.6 [Vitis vinifera]|uniref:Subtilisin-like protease SBT1.6 n=1 Tax=Vitis vinifera TaxID=29760 RepID=A0A438H2Z6_VITVI|nr:Subtilisin-like protease SBT1.6 [Vitis vinifera]
MEMASLHYRSSRILHLFVGVFVAQLTISLSAKVYVVYMGSRTSDDPDEILRQNHQMLTAVHKGSTERAQASHVYSYRHGFKGFAAKLTEQQASEMANMPGVVSVFPNLKRRLHTTHSWDFMGLVGEETMEIPGYSTKNQENVIIGFIDTGIWPESPSFSDDNMPSVPAGWNGQCQSGEAFNASSCNRKVIGARYYLSGYEAEEDLITSVSFKSPRDSSGHGSHTASTAAGRHVTNMNYKAWQPEVLGEVLRWQGLQCPEAPQGDYFNDAISLGSFHAASHGVVVVASVGNEGSQGDGANFTGESLSLFEMNASTSIISASEAYAGYFTPYQSSYCLESSLNNTKTRGKILVCQHAESSTDSKLAKSAVVREAGGVGMILIDEADKDVAIPFVIPAAIVGRGTGGRILSYINHTRKPVSRIFPAKTVLGSHPAPRVAAFSSKGPNALNPEILKPDVSAPGLNILAAWSPAIEKMHFNILSGTSMACPHVTGIVALVKAVHPSWSPSAIKSAIMTTATILDKNRRSITVDPEGRKGNAFDYGSGFVNPTRVLDPGLIYDTEPTDYKAFLCSIGYSEKLLHLITRDNSTCDQTFATASALNYPSITVPNLKDNSSPLWPEDQFHCASQGGCLITQLCVWVLVMEEQICTSNQPTGCPRCTYQFRVNEITGSELRNVVYIYYSSIQKILIPVQNLDHRPK